MFDLIVRWFRFNLWYFRNPPWDTGISPPELLNFIRQSKPGTALDLGCGTGTNVITLARAGWQVTGIDFALRAVESARRKCRQSGLTADLRVGNVAHLEDLAGPFDLILDIGCYHGLTFDQRRTYRQGLERLLGPGGIFLIYAHVRIDAQPQIGIDPHEIGLLSGNFHLVWREDSLDHRGRNAVWIQFER